MDYPMAVHYVTFAIMVYASLYVHMDADSFNFSKLMGDSNEDDE